MKGRKKGFTLTELIAVIVILAIIALVGIPAYNTIRSRTLEKQYDNTVALVETAAAKYASVHSTNLTNIQELIDNGLIETDDGTNLLDPRNNNKMNCLLIEVAYKKGNYFTKLLDIEECDLEKAQLENGDINILMRDLETGNVDNVLGKWTSKNVELLVDHSELDGKENIIAYRWSSATGHSSEDATMIMDVTGVFDSTVAVEVTTDADHKYFAKANLRIDKEAPVIEDIVVSGGNNWTKGRTIEIKATDKTGSGIGGYYIAKTPCDETKNFVLNSQSKYSVTIDGKDIVEDTDYYVCVKDKVGNITAYDKPITLSMKDKVAPKCTYSGENIVWTKNDVNITIGCEDNESGCDPDFSSHIETINYTAEKATVEYTIKDNAGNETVCSKEVNVFVDKEIPTTPTTMEFVYGDWSRYTMSDWTNKDVYIANTKTSNGPSGSADSNSGISHYEISSDGENWVKYNYDISKELYKISTTGTHTRYFRAVDKAGNVSGVLTKEIKIDKTKPTCGTVSGASTSWTKSARTITQGCNDSDSGCEQSLYSKNYTSTKETDTITIKDNAGNTNSCKYDVYVDTTGPTITLSKDGNSTYAGSASTKITVTDDDSGVKSIKRGWSKSSTSTKAETAVSSGTVVTSTCDITNKNECYLYVYACDKVGNCSSKRSKEFYIDKQAPTLDSISTIVDSNQNWCTGTVAHQVVRLSISDNVELASEPINWVYNHSCDRNSNDSSNSRSNKKDSKYYQCFGYSGNSTNQLTLKLTLKDKVGNTRNVNKTCYYSNETCS